MGLVKNTLKVATAEGKAIPDALTKTLSIEIKDTKVVTATKQLRIQSEAARASGRSPVLVTGTNSKVNSKAEGLFDAIIRRDDIGPKE